MLGAPIDDIAPPAAAEELEGAASLPNKFVALMVLRDEGKADVVTVDVPGGETATAVNSFVGEKTEEEEEAVAAAAADDDDDDDDDNAGAGDEEEKDMEPSQEKKLPLVEEDPEEEERERTFFKFPFACACLEFQDRIFKYVF